MSNAARALKVAAPEGPGELRERPRDGSPDRRIGLILAELGRIDVRQIEVILAQQQQNPKRFGELAIALGVASPADIDLALAEQYDFDFAPASPSSEEGDVMARVRGALPQQAEVLRAVRSQLVLRWFGPDVEQHTLAIVSLTHGDGRTHICAGLGALMAQMEEDTLLIDADLRRPRLHEIFQVDNRVGLSNYLRRETRRPPIRAVPGVNHLHVMPAGPAAADAHELVSRRQFGLMLEAIAGRYGFILIDTPAAATCSEALTIAVRSSGCLLVTRKHKTRLAEAQDFAAALTKHSVEVLGAVINDH